MQLVDEFIHLIRSVLRRSLHIGAIQYNILEHILDHTLIDQHTSLYAGAVLKTNGGAFVQGIADDLDSVGILMRTTSRKAATAVS